MSEPQAPKTQDFTTCPHWGKGGRYVVDPATGQRVPVVETPDNHGASVDNQVQESPGTGEVMIAIAGDTLLAAETSNKKGK